MTTKSTTAQRTVLNWRWWVVLPFALTIGLIAVVLTPVQFICLAVLWLIDISEKSVVPTCSKILKWVRKDF